MLTNKITISDDLLNIVRGILGEAKKCPDDCECQKCEAEEKKLKEDIMEMVNEAADGLSDKAKKSGVSLSTLKKVYARGIAAWNSGHRPGTTPQQWAHARVNSYITKGKGTYHGADKDLRSEGADMPFEGPYRKAGEERKDQYGNKVKNVAKYLAKKAMKSNEEVEHNNCGTPECCGQCDTPTQIDETAKIVAHLQKRYGDNIRKSHVRSAANDFGVDASKLAKAVRTKLGKNMLDEEQIDEISAQTVGSYREKAYAQQPAGDDGSQLYKKRKAGRDMAFKKVTRGAKVMAKEEHEEDDGWYTHSQMHGSKKSEKHPKGISAAEWKSGIRWHHGKNKRINIKEEVEQIDELSKGTMGRYINKAADRMSTQGVTAGLKIAADEKSKKNFDNIAKRQKGIATAVKKLTKEEQDFIDSLNDADAEQIDELSKDTMLKYLSANKKSASGGMGDKEATKRMRGTDMAVRKYTAKPGSKSVRVPATEETQIDEISDATLKSYSKKALDQSKTLTGDQKVKRQVGARNAIDRLGNNTLAKEEVELDEARGRPRKAGAKDFTIHPKTKEKLMHNNPEHMKKIEALQRNGVIPVPKVEAGQHIMNQLSKAKTSMLGGSKIHFTHGDSKEVSGTHAAKILTKYAGLKPSEKEDFQKFVGHSHENLMKHV